MGRRMSGFLPSFDLTKCIQLSKFKLLVPVFETFTIFSSQRVLRHLQDVSDAKDCL